MLIKTDNELLAKQVFIFYYTNKSPGQNLTSYELSSVQKAMKKYERHGYTSVVGREDVFANDEIYPV